VHRWAVSAVSGSIDRSETAACRRTLFERAKLRVSSASSEGGPLMFCEPIDFGHRCVRWRVYRCHSWCSARGVRLGISALPRNQPLDHIRLCGAARRTSVSDTLRRDRRNAATRCAWLGGVVHQPRHRRSPVRRGRSLRSRRAARLRVDGRRARTSRCGHIIQCALELLAIDFELRGSDGASRGIQ